MRVLRRVDPTKHLKVSFIGEAAVDDGGPRREYLRLVLASMMNQSQLLTGPATRKVPQHNSLAVHNGEFYLIGVTIVLSLTQGGPAPTFFAKSVVDYLFHGASSVTPGHISDIPDQSVQEKISEVRLIFLPVSY